MDDFYFDFFNEISYYCKNVVKDGEVDGKYYGVLMGYVLYFVYFNKVIFDVVGIMEDQYFKMWDDLVVFVLKLIVDKDGDGIFDQYGIVFVDKDVGYFLIFLQGVGIDLVVDGKVNLIFKKFKDIFIWICDNFYVKKFLLSNFLFVDVQMLFCFGKVVMFWIGFWIVNVVKEKGIEIGIFEMLKGLEKQVIEVVVNYWYMILQVDGNDVKKKVVYVWMKFFNNKKNQIIWVVKVNYLFNCMDVIVDDMKSNNFVF